ncbi:MAG: hypothetical protein PUB42_02075 [Firmicutes bacterium]|nr:hypothetical protein [Bacillota bacterium]
MSGEDLAVLVTAVAITSAQSLSVKDLNILVAVFTQLADTYATISVIRSLEEEKTETPAAQQEEDIVALETT